ncbi:Homeobox protein KNOX3 [Hordeum vulgare]|nr:Homeobox protein KNOX3 [Hordeum vulgare]
MTERYPDDGAAANGFGRRHLREDEARLLYEAEYPGPRDMRVPGSWRLNVGGVPVPPPPTGAERRAEIAHIRSDLPENSRNVPRYAPDSGALWTAFFDRQHADQLAATNGAEPRGRQYDNDGPSPNAHWRPSSSTSRTAIRPGRVPSPADLLPPP